MGHFFVFYMQDAYGIQQKKLPACDTDITNSFTSTIVGSIPSTLHLRRLFGARRSKIESLHAYQLDADKRLVGDHRFAKEALRSQSNLDTYPEDGSISYAIRNALIPVADWTNPLASAHSTHTRTAIANRRHPPPATAATLIRTTLNMVATSRVRMELIGLLSSSKPTTSYAQRRRHGRRLPRQGHTTRAL